MKVFCCHLSWIEDMEEEAVPVSVQFYFRKSIRAATLKWSEE